MLFVCLGNACRSPMAEAIARRDAPDVIEASSGGLFPLGHIVELTTRTLLQNGYPVDGLASKPITPELWNAADIVINMSGRLREQAFRAYRKVVDWNVQDPYGEDARQFQKVFQEIGDRVNDMAARLRARV